MSDLSPEITAQTHPVVGMAPDVRLIAAILGVEFHDAEVSLRGVDSGDTAIVLDKTATEFGKGWPDHPTNQALHSLYRAINAVHLQNQEVNTVPSDFWTQVAETVSPPLPRFMSRVDIAKCIAWSSVVGMMADQHSQILVARQQRNGQ